MYLSIGQAAEVIGVSVSTMRRWETEEKLIADFRTPGNHRRYNLDKINSQILNIKTTHNIKPRITIAYARVSSNDQKLDLKRQEKRLSDYCAKNDWSHDVISDLGSGLNYKKRGLNKLIDLICRKEVDRLILTHKCVFA